MPFTVTQVEAMIQSRGYGSDTTDAQLEAINAAVRRVNNYKRWPWNQAQASIALTAGTATAPAPSPLTLVVPRDVRITAIGSQATVVPLDYMEPDDLRDQLNTAADRGQPEYWSWYGGTVYVYPIPDQAYTVQLDYESTPAPLAAGSDTVNLPDEFVDIVAWHAIADMAYRERDWAARAQALAEFGQRIGEAARNVGLSHGDTTRVKDSGFFDAVNTGITWGP